MQYVKSGKRERERERERERDREENERQLPCQCIQQLPWRSSVIGLMQLLWMVTSVVTWVAKRGEERKEITAWNSLSHVSHNLCVYVCVFVTHTIHTLVHSILFLFLVFVFLFFLFSALPYWWYGLSLGYLTDQSIDSIDPQVEWIISFHLLVSLAVLVFLPCFLSLFTPFSPF